MAEPCSRVMPKFIRFNFNLNVLTLISLIGFPAASRRARRRKGDAPALRIPIYSRRLPVIVSFGSAPHRHMSPPPLPRGAPSLSPSFYSPFLMSHKKCCAVSHFRCLINQMLGAIEPLTYAFARCAARRAFRDDNCVLLRRRRRQNSRRSIF